jgi:hypothetical protein
VTDQFDEQTGEIIAPGQSISVVDNAALATLARVEIDQQISTARAYPRSIDRAVKNIVALATLDEETAEECCYALVRKKKKKSRGRVEDEKENKPIEGPSIRLAEIAAQQWGNNRNGAEVVEVNRQEKYVAAEGFFWDLETNAATKMVVRRSISTWDGGIFSADMIIVTGNAACAIAKRNAILAGVPRCIYRPAYAKAREIIAGTAETLSANRVKAIDAFKRFAVTPDQIFEALGVEGEGDIKPSHIATLRAMFSTLKNSESTVEEMFGKAEPDHKIVTNALADDPADEAKPAAQQSAAPAQQNAETDTGFADPSSQAAGADAGERDSVGAASAADLGSDNQWFAEGAKAARAGMSRKALPPELRSPDRADDAAEWFYGYDSVKHGGAQ